MAGQLTVRDLGETPLEQLHRTSTVAFRDYPVDIQMTLPQLESLCRQNSVRLELSAGLFDGDELVGFWINGVREEEGRKMAYDSGTAICKEYRGRGLSTRLASLSSSLLVEHGVQDYVLEVLTQNETAYAIYLKDGFSVQRKLLCLRSFEPRFEQSRLPAGISLEEGPFDPSIVQQLPAMEYRPSWQNATESVLNIRDEVRAVLARVEERIVGYGLATTEQGRIPQIGFQEDCWAGSVPSVVLERLCAAMNQKEIAVINVDPSAWKTLDLLAQHGFELYVDQYEMTKRLTADTDREFHPG